MKASFEVRHRAYQVSIQRMEKPEGEKFEPYEVTVVGANGGSVKGRLNLTTAAVELAGQRAETGGGSAEDWLARGCARSLAAEVLIRKLKPGFSFIVDHRWMEA